MTRLADQSERDLIRKALDKTLIVEAAAGTGKTTELVSRIISVLVSGRTSVDRIVAVTFTDKAAGELKLRLRAGLDKERASAGAGSDRCKFIEAALARLEEMRAGTIHGFCADLLRERPMEAGVDPESSPIDEATAERLYGSSFTRWLQEALENPPEGVRRSLRRFSKNGPVDRLREAGWELTTWRDFLAEWERPGFQRERQIDFLVNELEAFASLTAQPVNPKHPLHTGTAQARDLADDVRERERIRPRDYDGLEARLVALSEDGDFCNLRRTGYGETFGKGVARNRVLEAHRALVAALRQFADTANADLAALLHSELRETVRRYEEAKKKLSRLDFLDLLISTRDLLRDNPEVRADMQRQFTHIFVDEFQDTDPVQAEILILLSGDDPRIADWRAVNPVAGKLFVVGDPKQGIYRFRRADLALYQKAKGMLVARGAEPILLSTSFRAVPSIQNAVNVAFAAVMDGNKDALQAEYVPLVPFRYEYPDQPSLIALSVPHPYGVTGITATAIGKSLPDTVGAYIEWILNKSKWTVTERGTDERVSLAPRHICLLLRQFQRFGADIGKQYADALQARGIPHILVGGRAFHQREEVATLRLALSAIEWPDDELSVYGTLRGSLFAIPDEHLLQYREEQRRLHPFRIPNEVPAELAPITEALSLLKELHRNRNYRPVVQTITMLLNATRAHAGFVMTPSGEQVLANVLHMAELARAYEAGGGVSFRGFVEELLENADGGEAPEAAIFEEGAEGVRLMTIHKAKGLEFPVVVLGDITVKLMAQHASRHIDAERGLCAVRIAGWSPYELLAHEPEEIARERAEGIRLAYVAATRARDILVVPAVGDDATGHGPPASTDWWVGPLYRALYPPPTFRRKPSQPPQCPKFSKDSVVERNGPRGPGQDNVCPGKHDFGKGKDAYSVVWWDPRTLELGRTPQFSIRQEQLLLAGDRSVVESDLERYRKWQSERNATIQRGAQPTLRVQTATEIAAQNGDEADVELIELAGDGSKPSGLRFGSLVHAVLAGMPFDAGPEQIEALARLQARILDATPEEVAATLGTVSRVIQHDLWARARKAALAGNCRRESPVTYIGADGTLIEGIVDLAFRDGKEWLVVDFKTDHELRDALPAYRRQVGLYALAVRRATGEDVRAYLMKI